MVTTCAVSLDAVVQRDCTVLDEETGRYATASLVISSVNSDIHKNAYGGTAFCTQGLLLAAEVVVAPTGAEDGRTYKPKLYCRAGVPVYLLVELQRRKATMYSAPNGGVYGSRVEIDFGSELTLPGPLMITLDTKKLAK